VKKLLHFGIIGVLLSALTVNIIQPQMAAAADEAGEIMFILDASGSMLATDGGSATRFDKAKAALKQVVGDFGAKTKVGLRVYGSQTNNIDSAAGCQDSRLISAPAANNAGAITSALDNIGAQGFTLMGKSLQDTQADFKGTGPKTIILLSDGIDVCTPPDACEVAKSLSAGGTKVKINTLGLVVDNAARDQLKCIAQGGGGDYFDINNLDRLQSTLNSLAAREVSLFTAAGTPIKGTLRVDDAPTMLGNTSYIDTITVPQELYYGFDALPKQKITVTVKAVGRDTGLNNFDFLKVGGLNKTTGKDLKTVKFESARFGVNDPTTAVYELDTEKVKITEPTQIAFRVTIDPNNTSNVDGTNVPLEIKVTTEGGEEPDNKKTDDKSADAAAGDADNGPSTWMIVGLTLLAVAVLAAAAYAVKRFVIDKRRAQAKKSDTSLNPFNNDEK
jgi:hypothetical protein